MFWVHSDAGEPKVLHVPCHCYAVINLIFEIFDVHIFFFLQLLKILLVAIINSWFRVTNRTIHFNIQMAMEKVLPKFG